MTPLLEQFLSEARDSLQGMAEKLMQLERSPEDSDQINDLFRLVHTLKGNSGLFDFPEMTRVLHASEDLMDAVRKNTLVYSPGLSDKLLDAVDFVSLLCDEIESEEYIDIAHSSDSVLLAESLELLIPNQANEDALGSRKTSLATDNSVPSMLSASSDSPPPPFADIPETIRMESFQRLNDGEPLHWIAYTPLEECFFQGDDPFYSVRQTPGLLWGRIVAREHWPSLMELDAYRCVLNFHVLSTASQNELLEHYRYVMDQVNIRAAAPFELVIPQGTMDREPADEDLFALASPHLESSDLVALKRFAQSTLELYPREAWVSSTLRWLALLLDCAPNDRDAMRMLIESLRTLTPPNWADLRLPPIGEALERRPMSAQATQTLSEEDAEALDTILAAQRQILAMSDRPVWQSGRLKAVAAVLMNCVKTTGVNSGQVGLEEALSQALSAGDGAPLLSWLDAHEGKKTSDGTIEGPCPVASAVKDSISEAGNLLPSPVIDEGVKFDRRANDVIVGAKHLKVDQAKIDRLMDLIGEMVVSKNALPYLAQRAEDQFGVRELAREIKAQYAVINRITEEMQDAIMQVRMLPVSFVLQRFPRLVREISRKLDKEVQLVLEGEETEADKNIIESLSDPLIHIIRNSLDHGIEKPDVRRACGKPAMGTITIRAVQKADRVLIEIIDDGKGIDPLLIKRKAYEKGIIDESALDRLNDQDAINLIFEAELSTAEVVSDLSGRGVGMDVVRTAVEKVNGFVTLSSELGKGTCIGISLPLSMAMTQVMIVESDRQLFGVPMDSVVETVRIPRKRIRKIKHNQTTVFRKRIVPLKSLNALLGLLPEPRINSDDELAILVTRVSGEMIGIVVDDFQKTVDVIQKPMSGVLAGLSAYSGSALMGDGTVLMILNIKEIV